LIIYFNVSAAMTHQACVSTDQIHSCFDHYCSKVCVFFF